MVPFDRNVALAAGAAFSVALHVWIAGGISALPKGESRAPTSIKMVEVKKKPKPEEKKEEKKEPPKPPEAPKIATQAKPPPTPAPAPEPTPAPAPAPGPATGGGGDYGLTMTGGGGVAVPMGGGGGGDGKAGPAPSASAPKEKVFGGSNGSNPAPGIEECNEPEVKAKLLGSITPQYTDDARSAEIEGVVQLKLTIDATGTVTAVAVLKGLGHGLDDGARASAKSAKFQAATRCGKPSATTMVINVRYQLGE